MTFLLYLLLAGPGLGYDLGYGVGLTLGATPGPVTILLTTDYTEQSKVEFDSGDRSSALLEVQYGQRLFGSLGASVSRTRTPEWTKTGQRLVVGLGTRLRSYSFLVRGYLPDSTANRLSGLQLQAEYLGRFYFRWRISFWQFDGSERDTNVQLAAGWRFK